jgi:hypothetical protein
MHPVTPARAPISESQAAMRAVPPPSQPSVPVRRPPQPAGDLPAFLNLLPPKLRTQEWLMVFAAGAVLLGLGLLYVVVSLIANVV